MGEAEIDALRVDFDRELRLEFWSLTTLREKVVKIGAKVVKHSRYEIFPLAEVAVPRELFAAILQRIAGLREAPS